MSKQNTTDETVSLFFSTFRSLKQKMDFSNPLYHMPLAHMETLRFVGEKQEATMKEVADFLAITPPSATVLVNNLVKTGLLLRKSAPNDRRSIYLRLTKKGQTVLGKGIEQRCKTFKSMLDKLNQRQKTEFLNILKRLTSEN